MCIGLGRFGFITANVRAKRISMSRREFDADDDLCWIMKNDYLRTRENNVEKWIHES